MSLILSYVEPRFALVGADTLVALVDNDGYTAYADVDDKVTASEGAILAIYGQDRVSRPARGALAAEGALSATGIREALTCVRRQTRAMLLEEQETEPDVMTPWLLSPSSVFATYTARRGRRGPRECRIGVWNSHGDEQLAHVQPRTPTANDAATRSDELAAVLADWRATAGRGPHDVERAIRWRIATAREVFGRAARAWRGSSSHCRFGVHLADPEELRLTTMLPPGTRLQWALRAPPVRKRKDWTPERTVRCHGWPRGNGYGWSARGAADQEPEELSKTLPRDREKQWSGTRIW